MAGTHALMITEIVEHICLELAERQPVKPAPVEKVGYLAFI
jgi:hypothetical protein